MLLLVIIALFIGIVFLFLQFKKLKDAFTLLKEKYKDVINVDEYKEKVTAETNQMLADRNGKIASLDEQISDLKEDYSKKHSYWGSLVHEISLYEEQQEIMSYGLYKPHFDFDTSEKYKDALEEVREKGKRLIQEEKAAICTQEWSVNGSASEGKKQTKRYIKLMLRAFNGECEALIADVRWNNIGRMEERLQKSFEAINKLGETHTSSITQQYMKLKLDELRLAFEYQDKLHQEKEEQKRIQEQIREEEKAQKEIEKALKDSEDEENRYSKALEQAKKEMEKAQGEALVRLQEKMAKLQNDLDEALAQKQRALSMAQQTKAGHVYVISNIGSFGKNVYKIGMTRRLEPMDRVKELGDASVPFEFDVHAMIYSENAPELENALHKEFDEKRLNLINERKEFFNVSLDEIEKVTKERNLNIEFTKIAEAREYLESNAIREQNENKTAEPIESILDKIPQSI
jgi:hypothetical protein